MDLWIRLFLPFTLLLGRIGAFFAVLPLFSWRALPMRLRAALAVLTTVFFAMVRPVAIDAASVGWAAAAVLMVQEIAHGLALGLAVSFVFLGVQQGGRMVSLQTGMGDAGIIDPVSAERARPLDMFFEMGFALLFLAADGHHLFLLVVDRSYDVFPVGSAVNTAALAGALVHASSTMLLLALKLAAPVLAAFLLLGVVLAILARVLPEMNILLTSFPLRVGLGLFMAAVIFRSLEGFTTEIADWIQKLLVG
jgi:flagellar biosynthetic protein FliR